MNTTAEPPRARRTSLLNRAAVRAFTLEQSRHLRLGRFTRISEEWFEELEAHVRTAIAARVHRAPSLGKTLKP